MWRSWGGNQYVLFCFTIDTKENYKYCTVRCAVEHYTVIINYHQLFITQVKYIQQSQNQKIMGNSQCLKDDVTSILFYWAIKALAISSKY